jgi:hypothetical protein
MKRLPKSVEILGQVWRIVPQPRDVLHERYGACDYDTCTIYVYDHTDHADESALLGTLAHEIIHAAGGRRMAERRVIAAENAIMEIFSKVFV